ncbi:unnamed protein product [uncultured bacterium]|nr:unnamed protein product [uncultured bacterium]
MKRTNWPFVRLGEIAEFRNGLNYNKDNFGKGLKVVNVKDFQDRLIADLSDLEEINPDGVVREECLPKDGDIIFVRSNGNRELIGRSMLVKAVMEPVSHSAFSIKVRFSAKGVLPRFYAYVFRTALIRTELSNRGGGTNISNLNQDILNSLEVPKPTLATQSKIASVLSAYDDLIENNTRRIAILEAMAQAIYREWFVEFRFPGHEKVKLVDSPLGKIPEGWKVSTLEGACQSVIDGDWIETKDQGGNDYRLLQVSNIGTGCFIETGNFRYVTKETFDRLRCQEVKPCHILISRMPKPIGRAWLVTEMAWKMITAVDVAIAMAHPDRSTAHFLVNYLNSPEHIENAEKHATGTTRPRVSRSALSSLRLVLPPLNLQQQFTALVADGYSLITALRKKADVIRRTRDLLLPRLISGELDVEDLDIDTAEAVTE